MSSQAGDSATNVGTEGESSVIKELRSSRDEWKAKAEAAEAQLESGSKARREAAENLLKEAGFPKLTDVVLDKVDGFPTKDTVGAVLESLGLAQPGESATSTEGDDDAQGTSAEDVAGVANLGQQVANAAGGTASGGLDEKLAKAESPEEIAAIMQEAGLAHIQ